MTCHVIVMIRNAINSNRVTRMATTSRLLQLKESSKKQWITYSKGKTFRSTSNNIECWVRDYFKSSTNEPI